MGAGAGGGVLAWAVVVKNDKGFVFAGADVSTGAAGGKAWVVVAASVGTVVCAPALWLQSETVIVRESE